MLRGPKLCGANIEGKIAPRSFGPLNLCLAEFWTRQPVPNGVLEQCNLCPAKFWRHSFWALKKNTKMIKKLHFPSFITGIFVSLGHFRDLYNQYNHFLGKKSRIRDTLTLSTVADSRTNTNLKRLFDFF